MMRSLYWIKSNGSTKAINDQADWLVEVDDGGPTDYQMGRGRMPDC